MEVKRMSSEMADLGTAAVKHEVDYTKPVETNTDAAAREHGLATRGAVTPSEAKTKR